MTRNAAPASLWRASTARTTRRARRARQWRLRLVTGLVLSAALVVAMAALMDGLGRRSAARARNWPTVRLASNTANSQQASPAAPGSAPPGSSPQATSVCSARLAQYAGSDNPMHVTLDAAYAATAADVAADDEHRHGSGYTSRWRERPAHEFEAVCFFDASAFGQPPRLLPGPTPSGVFDRLEEIVRPDGTPIVYVAGFQRNLAVQPIPRSTP